MPIERVPLSERVVSEPQTSENERDFGVLVPYEADQSELLHFVISQMSETELSSDPVAQDSNDLTDPLEEDSYSVDPVRQLLREIHHPILSYEQQQLLFRLGPRGERSQVDISNVKAHPDFERAKNLFTNRKDRRRFESIAASSKNLADFLVAQNLRLIPYYAKKYSWRGVPFLDLVNEGTFGLMTAVEKFDPDRPAHEDEPDGPRSTFSTYASWWVKQSMLRAIGNTSREIRLPIHMHDKVTSMYKVSRKLQQELGKEPTRKQIAAAMGLKVEAVEEMLQYAKHTVSLDAPLGSDESGELTLGSIIPSPTEGEEAIFKVVGASMLKEDVSDTLSMLSPRERLVIQDRFGLGDGRVHTLQEIADALQLSRERVRQLEANALQKLRHPRLSRRLRSHHFDSSEPVGNYYDIPTNPISSKPHEVAQPTWDSSIEVKQIKEEEKQPRKLPTEVITLLNMYYASNADQSGVLSRLSIILEIPIPDLAQVISLVRPRSEDMPISTTETVIFENGKHPINETVRLFMGLNMSQGDIHQLTGYPLRSINKNAREYQHAKAQKS